MKFVKIIKSKPKNTFWKILLETYIFLVILKAKSNVRLNFPFKTVSLHTKIGN